MTATLQPESKSTSRRALLAGALGGIGALAATVIGRASPVRGGVDGDVVLGASNTATSTTRITNMANSSTVLSGESGSGIGVWGQSGSSFGVSGSSGSSIGVSGNSGSSFGVFGSSSASDRPATVGQSSAHSTGVLGVSGGEGGIPTAKPKTGVYGYANQDNTSSGVYGLSPLGVGVRGHSASGYAGYFEGRVYTNKWYELGEVANPAPPLANRARLFVRDNGAGKTQLCVRFHTGGVHIIKTEL